VRLRETYEELLGRSDVGQLSRGKNYATWEENSWREKWCAVEEPEQGAELDAGVNRANFSQTRHPKTVAAAQEHVHSATSLFD